MHKEKEDNKKGYNKKGQAYSHGELNNHVTEDQIDFGGGEVLNNTQFSSADEYGENIGNDSFAESSELKNGTSFYGLGPKGWKHSDENIREEASEALYHDHAVDARDIEVLVEDNCLYLRGTVNSKEEKKAAERCVENIAGVQDVQNELKIYRTNSAH